MFISNIINEIITKYTSVVFSFLNSILISRLLSDTGRGDYALYTNVIQLSLLLFSFSLSTSFINKIAKAELDVPKSFSLVCLYYTIVGSGFYIIIDLFNLGPILYNMGESIELILIFSVLTFYFSSLNTIFFGIFYGMKKVKGPNAIKLISVISFSTLIFITLFFEFGSFEGFLILIKIQCLIQLSQFLFFVVWYSFNSKFPFTIRVFKDINHSILVLKDLFSSSKLVYISGILMFLIYRLDFWIVDHFKSKEELGVYSLAVQLSQFILILPSAIEGINLSEVSSNPKKGIVSSNWSIKVTIYISILFSIAIFLFTFFFVESVFGPEFKNVVFSLGILLVGISFFSPVSIISSYLIGIDKFKVNVIAVLIALVLSVFLDFLLIPNMGIVGASIATSIAYLFITVILMNKFLSYSNQNLSQVILISNSEIHQIKNLILKL